MGWLIISPLLPHFFNSLAHFHELLKSGAATTFHLVLSFSQVTNAVVIQQIRNNEEPEEVPDDDDDDDDDINSEEKEDIDMDEKESEGDGI